jgi:hypothetical protein
MACRGSQNLSRTKIYRALWYKRMRQHRRFLQLVVAKCADEVRVPAKLVPVDLRFIQPVEIRGALVRFSCCLLQIRF